MADNNRQKSSDQAFINSMKFLEEARDKIAKVRSQVNEERMTLAGAYQGEDGTAMQQKFVEWLDAVQSVSNTCLSMENTLNENRQRSNSAQQQNLSAVQHLSGVGGDTSTSNNTYQALTSPS